MAGGKVNVEKLMLSLYENNEIKEKDLKKIPFLTVLFLTV